MIRELLVFGLLVLMLSAVQAASALELSTDYSKYSMIDDDRLSTQLHIYNPGFDKVCFALDSDNDSEDRDLRTEFAVEELCLNGKESTSLGITFDADSGTDEGVYEVIIEAEEDLNSEISTHTVEVLINKEDIEFILPRNLIIQNNTYKVEVEVEVENNLGEDKGIQIAADSELFLPRFDTDEIGIEDNEEVEVDLILNLNPTFREGRYAITLFAFTDELLVKRTFNFKLEETDEPKPTFQLNAPKSCFTVNKGDERRINFGVENFSQRDKVIELSVLSELKVDLNFTKLNIEPQDTNFSFLTVYPDNTDEGKEYKITVFAVDKGEVKQQEICVKVPDERAIDFELLQQLLQVEQGGSNTFAIEVINDGDERETVEVSFTNPHSDVQVAISEDEISVPSYSKGIVLITIAPDIYAPLGQRDIDVTLSTVDAPSITPVSRDQAIVVDIDNFSKSIDPDSVKFRYNSVTYSANSSNIEFDSGTDTILFYPPTTLKDDTDVSGIVSWEDTEENFYTISFGFDVGDEHFDHYFTSIEVEELPEDIDTSTIEFEFEGDLYTINDIELKFFLNQELEFRPEERVRLGERLSYEFDAEDEDGRELSIDATYTVDFSGAGTVRDKEELRFDIESMEHEIDEESIEVKIENLRFDNNDAELDVDLETDREDASIVLEYGFGQGVTVDTRFSFEDGKNNEYFIDYDFVPGDDQLKNLVFETEIFSLTSDLEEDDIEIRWNGERFDVDDDQLEIDEVAGVITFTPTVDYYYGDTFEIQLDVKDRRGRSFNTEFDITPAFSGKSSGGRTKAISKFEFTDTLTFEIVEPKILAEGGLELLAYPKKVILEEGESRDISFIVRNNTPVLQKNVRIKAKGFDEELFITTLYMGDLDTDQVSNSLGKITARPNAGLGTYTITLEIVSERNVIYQDISIEIVEKQAEEFEGLYGLVGFFVGTGAAGLGLIVLVILFVIIASARLKKHEEKEGSQPWMRKARQQNLNH